MLRAPVSLVAGAAIVTVASVVAALLAAPPEPLASPVVRSRFGEFELATPAPYDGWLRSSRYVAARDGTRLATDLYRPTRGGVVAVEPLPVVFTMTPYRRAVVDGDGDGGAIYGVVDLYDWLPEVLRRGYVVACVEVRGTGASFGRFQGMFHPLEAQDGYDLVEWLAAQPWSTGKIGMFGQSYLGITQFRTASLRPPHLAAIFPEMAAADMYELVWRGGIDHTPLLASWSERLRQRDADEAGTVPVDEDGDRALLRAALAEHRASRAAVDVYAAAPFRDSVDPVSGAAPFREWNPIGRLADLRASNIPVYHLTGWFDRYVRDQLVLYRNLSAPQRITVGPWVHSEMSELDYAAEHLRWWEQLLKGVDTGVLDEEPVHYYLMGAPPNGWRAARSWPLAGERRETWRLAGGPSGASRLSGTTGALAGRPSRNDGTLGPAAAPGELARDLLPVDFTATVDPNPRFTTAPAAPELSANDAKGLTYTSTPLAAPIEAVGHPVAHLWISSSATDGDLFVYLEDVDASGASRYVSEGALRASNRATGDPGYDVAGLPYHPSRAGDRRPLEPGVPVELAIELYPTAWRFGAGHRVRLTVTGADASNTRVPPAPVPLELTLWRGPEHDSRLELPTIPPF